MLTRLAILAALLVFFAWLAACGGTINLSPTPAGPAYLAAVRPLQVKIVDLEEQSLAMNFLREAGMLEGAAIGDVKNICTISATDLPPYWITAAHCVSEIGKEGRYVEGVVVEPVDVRVEIDTAIVKIPGLHMHGLHQQKKPVDWLQDILIVGHPFGYNPVFITKGYVANPRGLLDGTPYMLLNVAAAPGNSGSPVLNLRGEIVSILQIGWGLTFSPVTGGAPYENLRLFDQYFEPEAVPMPFEEIPPLPVRGTWGQ